MKVSVALSNGSPGDCSTSETIGGNLEVEVDLNEPRFSMGRCPCSLILLPRPLQKATGHSPLLSGATGVSNVKAKETKEFLSLHLECTVDVWIEQCGWFQREAILIH